MLIISEKERELNYLKLKYFKFVNYMYKLCIFYISLPYIVIALK